MALAGLGGRRTTGVSLGRQTICSNRTLGIAQEQANRLVLFYLGRFRRERVLARLTAWWMHQRLANDMRRLRRDLNERGRRLFAAAEARTAGHGGISASSRATGVARSTIGRGLKDLDDPGALSGVVRRPGSGRHALTVERPHAA